LKNFQNNFIDPIKEEGFLEIIRITTEEQFDEVVETISQVNLSSI